MKKYLVTFEETEVIKQMIECVVECDSEDDIKECLQAGDYEYVDSYEVDCLDSEITNIDSIAEYINE